MKKLLFIFLFTITTATSQTQESKAFAIGTGATVSLSSYMITLNVTDSKYQAFWTSIKSGVVTSFAIEGYKHYNNGTGNLENLGLSILSTVVTTIILDAIIKPRKWEHKVIF